MWGDVLGDEGVVQGIEVDKKISVKKSINVIAATMTVMTTTIHPMVTTSRQ
jgi:hypothetical protein